MTYRTPTRADLAVHNAGIRAARAAHDETMERLERRLCVSGCGCIARKGERRCGPCGKANAQHKRRPSC